MMIPTNMTETETIATISKVVNRLGKKYTFGFYSVEDVRQEAWIIAIESLDKYDEERPLENFLAVVLSRRLLNLKRNKFCRPDEICDVCKNKDPNCKKCKQREMRNQSKKFLMEPIDISHIRDEHEKNMRLENDFISDIEDGELFAIIDKHLPVELRGDYLRLKSGVYISKPRREQIHTAIYEIFEEHYK